MAKGDFQPDGCGCLLQGVFAMIEWGLFLTGKKPKSRSQRQQEEIADLRLRVAELEVELRKKNE